MTRRLVGPLLALGLLIGSLGLVAPPAVAATCGGQSTLVPQTEGPYYTPNAPSRRNVTQADTDGTSLVLTGMVLDAGCRPIAGAKLDFWQADGQGVYDNSGFRLRGTQRTSQTGTFRLATVIPGQYPGRTEHIHVKITPPGGRTVTTQLYFPGSSSNDSDGIYDSRMVVRIASDTPRQMRATFRFVMPAR